MATDLTTDRWNRIHNTDCVAGLRELPAESANLAFADPPFNIGYEYDVYKDKLEKEHYLDWCESWMRELHRVLASNGTFWLAIGDEYAAELKITAEKAGFHLRSWVIWYYTFGVHCKNKFTRSHAHLFYFIKDKENFCFNISEIAVPSARQLIYADRRANPKGRSPDDTWILRPQDCRDSFQPNENIWYIPRVNGTFKERAGFHGCQMPEQLLGRIIRSCSQEGDRVIDPFSGSATTLVVAKKLRRSFLGFELSEEYSKQGTERLERTFADDKLEGAEDPRFSVKSQEEVRELRITKRKKSQGKASLEAGFLPGFFDEPPQVDPDTGSPDPGLTDSKLIEALEQMASENSAIGMTIERLIFDPAINQRFQSLCDRLKIELTSEARNRHLFHLRKTGQWQERRSSDPSIALPSWKVVDPYVFASEIAWRRLSEQYPNWTLEELFCSPDVAKQFDQLALQLTTGCTEVELRAAAFLLREQKTIEFGRMDASVQSGISPEEVVFPESNRQSLKGIQMDSIPNTAGIYRLSDASDTVWYFGTTLRLGRRFLLQFSEAGIAAMEKQIGPASEIILDWVEFPIDANRPLFPLELILLEQPETEWNVGLSKVALAKTSS